jgi:hypothetical protein
MWIVNSKLESIFDDKLIEEHIDSPIIRKNLDAILIRFHYLHKKEVNYGNEERQKTPDISY